MIGQAPQGRFLKDTLSDPGARPLCFKAGIDNFGTCEPHVYFWSNTRVSEEAWPHIFDQMMHNPHADGPHECSTFSLGIKVTGEHINGAEGDTFLAAQRTYEDKDGTEMTEHLFGRSGIKWDESGQGSDLMSKVQHPWDPIYRKGILGGRKGYGEEMTISCDSLFEPESGAGRDAGSNLTKLFEFGMEHAGEAHKNWFLVVIGPVAKFKETPLLELRGADGDLDGTIHMALGDPTTNLGCSLVDFYANIYVPAAIATELQLPVSLVCMEVQGTEVTADRSMWEQKRGSILGGDEGTRIHMVDIITSPVGKVGSLCIKELDDEKDAGGVLIGQPGSGRFLTTNARALFQDALGDGQPLRQVHLDMCRDTLEEMVLKKVYSSKPSANVVWDHIVYAVVI